MNERGGFIPEIEREQALQPVNLREEAEIKQRFVAANEKRDYSTYTWLMDAALEAKAQAIVQHFPPLTEGATVVDAGSGTGKLGELIAKEIHGAKVYGLDLSHELLEKAEYDRALIHPVYGNAKEQVFPANSIDVKYYSTSGHEVESFGGPGSMREAVRNSFAELKPGGRLIIRDFAKPERTEPVLMEIRSEVGKTAPSKDADPLQIDYNVLSPRAIFERFHREFRGGNAFNYEVVVRDNKEYIKIDPEWAYEYFMRKDYTGNWRQEIQEKYSYWTPSEAKTIFEEEGFTSVAVIPDPNAYIIENRLQGKIGLYEEGDDGQLREVPFFLTHMVVRGDKPKSKQEVVEGSPSLPVVDYQAAFNSIEFAAEESKLRIGSYEFSVVGDPVVGTKKRIFELEGTAAPTVLKVVREDTKNDHNVFTSMYEMVARQEVLRQLQIPHLALMEVDPEGPPYRYVTQAQAPEGSICMADLVRDHKLLPEHIEQITRVVNACELGKQWQLDMNPFSWYLVPDAAGNLTATYVSGKVYRYDEQWEFRKVGLLQWLDAQYVKNAALYSAALPKAREYGALQQQWESDDPSLLSWKKALHPRLQPEVQSHEPHERNEPPQA